MQTSLAKFRTDVTEAALDFLVDQWRHLSSSSAGSGRQACAIDPEVLIALTSSLGRHDSRVFDVMVDWLVTNGCWINAQRLARLAMEDGYADRAAIGAVAAFLASRDRASKWKRLATIFRPATRSTPVPLFHGVATPGPGRRSDALFTPYGLERAPLVVRSQAGPVRMRHPAAVFCTSRAVFGVAIRADVMAYLVSNHSAHARGLAASLGYNHMQVRAVLRAIEQAEIAVSHSERRTRQYSIDAGAWRPVLLGEEAAAEWVNWRRLARGLHAIISKLWAIDAKRVDPELADAVIQDTVRDAREDILQGHAWLSHAGGRVRVLGEPLARQLASLDGRRNSIGG